jgi:predicted metal-dependent phosphoesterase TrpH
MAFRCLFHVHTWHSFDSIQSPASILRQARSARVDVLIIADHDTIAGAQEVRELAQGNPKFVVTAAEYKSEKGDLIGLFLKHEIRARRASEIVEQVHAQGGLVVLPHPFKAHRLDSALLAAVDLIEVHNARCSTSENKSAVDLASHLGLPVIGGPDAHCGAELRAVINHFDTGLPPDEAALQKALRSAPCRIETRPVSRLWVPYSQMIKAVKTRNPRLFLSQAKRLATTMARESLRPRSAATAAK